MTYIRNGGAAIKTVTFAIVHFSVAFSIAYLLDRRCRDRKRARSYRAARLNTVAYYFHERVWTGRHEACQPFDRLKSV